MYHFSRRLAFKAAAGAALAPALGGLTRPAAAQQFMGDAYSVMAADERFTTWVRLIDAGGLQSAARSPSPYTVFAITETGFAKFPQVVQDLLGYQQQAGSHNDANVFPDTSKIVRLIRSHVTRGKHYANEVMGKTLTVTTVAGTPLKIDGTKQPVTITWMSQATNGSLTAVVPDVPLVAINAVIYPIDDVGVSG